MIAGHFGLSALVKANSPKTPLWALMLATQWLDVLFVPLMAAGVETITPTPGGGGYGEVIIHADYTHSLLGVLLISALFGLWAARRWGKQSGVILGAMVSSHWLLDLLVHRADMPLLPNNWGGLPRLGFGLWQYPMVTALMEAALVVAGGVFYWRAAARVNPNQGLPATLGASIVAVGLLVLGLNFAGL